MKIKTLTSAVTGVSLLALAAPAFATVVDNINFPESAGPHVFAGTVNENTTTTIGDELTGSGTVNSIDGSTDICGTGTSCTLTYNFGGYVLQDITSNTASFSDGYVNFYANGDMSSPFLTLEADREQGSQYTLEGTLTNAGTSEAQNTAVGLLSVTGGSAADIFNNDSYENGDGGLSDLLFNTSLSPSGDTTFAGSADGHYVSPSSDVPEPGALAMLGLGLILVGFGVNYHRRRYGNMG